MAEKLKLVAAAAGCAIAITSCGGDSGAVATPASHSSASPFADVQREQRSPGVFIAANRIADDGTRGSQILPAPLEAEPKGSEVLVTVGVGSCSEKRPAIGKIALVEGPERLILTAYVLYAAKQENQPCSEVEHVLPGRVQLKAPNGNRPIYDGVRWPLEQVWPGR